MTLIGAKISKKLQLYWFLLNFLFDLTPYINNICILLIRHSKDCNTTKLWNKGTNTFDMDFCRLQGGSSGSSLRETTI